MGKLIVLMIVAFVDMVGLVMLLPLLPFYALRFGATATTIGILISAFSVAQLLSAPFWGQLSDRSGRRPAILTGLWISAAAYIVFAFAGSILMLLLSRLVQGFGGGTIGVVQAYVADSSTPQDRVKGLGWLSAVTSFGAMVGPALGSALSALWGPHAPGLASAALCALASLFAWVFLAESKERVSASYAAPGEPITSRDAIISVVSRSAEPASRLIWIYAIAIGAFYGTAPTMPILLSERLGVTEHNMGYFIMYLGGIGLLVRSLFLGPAVKWLGEARLARLGVVLLATGLSLISFVYTYPVLWLALTLMPLGTAFIFPSVTGLLTRVVASRDRGLYLSVQQTFGGIFRVAFPAGAGLLMDSFGKAVPFWLSGVLVLGTLGLMGRLEEYGR